MMLKVSIVLYYYLVLVESKVSIILLIFQLLSVPFSYMNVTIGLL